MAEDGLIYIKQLLHQAQTRLASGVILLEIEAGQGRRLSAAKKAFRVVVHLHQDFQSKDRLMKSIRQLLISDLK